MDLTHLHLHVRDRARAVAFYQKWFGLRVVSSDDVNTFMRGDRDFLFALMEDPARGVMPPWFHFGIQLDSSAHVRETLAAMEAGGVPIVRPLNESEALSSFRCADPEAYTIEVYWAAAPA